MDCKIALKALKGKSKNKFYFSYYQKYISYDTSLKYIFDSYVRASFEYFLFIFVCKTHTLSSQNVYNVFWDKEEFWFLHGLPSFFSFGVVLKHTIICIIGFYFVIAGRCSILCGSEGRVSSAETPQSTCWCRHSFRSVVEHEHLRTTSTRQNMGLGLAVKTC